MRIGHGYDVHRLAENRDLYLCGEKIDYSMGLLGHSDADAPLHALCDALLGAAAMGDIGKHFPDNDESYKGISSLVLLERVIWLLKEKNYYCMNCDITIVCQKPKLAPYINSMRRNIAKAMNIDIDSVSVKATTTEGLGFEGTGEGISSSVVVLIDKI